jgi:hypothetical protein
MRSLGRIEGDYSDAHGLVNARETLLPAAASEAVYRARLGPVEINFLRPAKGQISGGRSPGQLKSAR